MTTTEEDVGYGRGRVLIGGLQMEGWICKECGYPLLNEALMKQHIKTHEAIKKATLEKAKKASLMARIKGEGI